MSDAHTHTHYTKSHKVITDIDLSLPLTIPSPSTLFSSQKFSKNVQYFCFSLFLNIFHPITDENLKDRNSRYYLFIFILTV